MDFDALALILYCFGMIAFVIILPIHNWRERKKREQKQEEEIRLAKERYFKANPPQKASSQQISKSATHPQNPTSSSTIKQLNDKVSQLEFENSRLKRENSNLNTDISYHKSIEIKKQKEIDELREMNSVSVIDDLKMRLRLAEHSNEDYRCQILELNRLIDRLEEQRDFYISESASAGDRYSKELSVIRSNLSDDKFASNLYLNALQNLESGKENILFQYPTMLDFYQRVKDKRFHRSMFEKIKFISRISVSTTIQSETGALHDTSLTSCSCPDFAKTKQPCKHMLFLAYHVGVLGIRKDLLEKNMKIYLDELRSTKPKK